MLPICVADVSTTGGSVTNFAATADPKVYTATFTQGGSSASAASASGIDRARVAAEQAVACPLLDPFGGVLPQSVQEAGFYEDAVVPSICRYCRASFTAAEELPSLSLRPANCLT